MRSIITGVGFPLRVIIGNLFQQVHAKPQAGFSAFTSSEERNDMRAHHP